MNNNEKINLMLEDQGHTSKPDNAGTVRKHMRLTETSVQELSEYLVSGHSMYCHESIGDKAVDWRSQKIFALDFDDNSNHDEIINRLISYGIRPCFGYTTFSDSPEWHKFRLVFNSNTLITIPAIRRAIVHAFMVICPESDKACKDAARLIYGGKSLIYTDYDATFNPITLITQAMPNYLKNTDEHNNYSRYIKDYCKTAGLNICNDIPDIRPTSKDKYFCECVASKNDVNSASSIYYNIEFAANTSKNDTDNFDWGFLHSDEFAGHVLYQDWRTAQYYDFNFAKPEKIKTNKKGETKVTYSVEKRKESYNEDLIRNFDFQALNDNCRLVREINNREYWASHDILFGIGSNYACIEGGDSEFEELVDNNVEGHEYAYTEDNISGKYNITQYARKMGYCPARCENFCPHKDECPNEGLNMLSANPKKINNKIRKLSDTEITYISKTDAENDTYMAISEALTANDNKIHCIKAPTGIGKTQIYTSMNLSNVCVALPTHDLKNEVYNRILNSHASNSDIACKQKFMCPDDTINQKYQMLLKVGEYSEATKFLMDSVSNPQYSRDTLNYISNYLNNIDSLKKADTVITTHANMLHLKNPNIETYLIDEDITQSLLQITEYNPDDLTILIHQMEIEYGDDDLTTKQLKEIQKTIDSMPQFIYMPFPKVKISDTKKMNRCIATLADRLETNIPNILTSDFIIKNENNILCAKSIISQLRTDKTYIILSATLDQKMCEYMFKDRLVFTDIGNIRIDNDVDCTTGTIYQYPKYSTARAAIRADVNRTISYIENSVPNIDKNINMITFANCEQLFKNNGFTNQIAHFGACSGIDVYGGQDLLVVGTPHINQDAYMLYALMLGKNVSSLDCDDCKLKRQNVKRNGYEFTFMTFEDNFLQTIQLWAIEQELYQAIGRARALRNECKVYVFSNLPLLNTKIAA